MRVLIATVTAGGGHLQAAAALEDAWQSMRPEDGVHKVDLLDGVSPLFRRVYAEGYVQLVAHAPELWGMMFSKTDNPALVQRITRFRRGFARRTYRNFLRMLREFRPDVVVCTHYQPLEILSGTKEHKDGPRPFTVCVVTDFEAHAFWMAEHVDLYFVAAPETRAGLVARGVAPDKVIATGIPVAAKFGQAVETGAVRRALGIRDDLPTLLVLGGGFGTGPIGKILGALDKVAEPLQTLVVAGRNEELRRELAVLECRHPTRVIGYASNMHELMGVADLIISKPGGLTSSEALALGRPLCIINPIPGQEAANSDFLLEHGAAVKVNRIDDLPFRLEQLLGSDKLDELARTARALGRPAAAAEICREVVARVEAAGAAPRD
jgi:processive 1,2-diacylglycerol beta-glucosyltransferase